MQLIENYQGIERTLICLKDQIIDSIDFCEQLIMPDIYSPEQLFEYLKMSTTYKRDPKDRELLQESKTFFYNNYWGESGAGDCDCFTITAAACLIAMGLKDVYIVIVGNQKRAPTHIYAAFKDKGKLINFDLTCGDINVTRPYKYKQLLKINIP